MSYCDRNYLPFFFTHEVQEVTPEGIRNWIDIVRPSIRPSRPTVVNQNVIHAQLGDDEESGNAVVSSLSGEFFFDASSSIPVDSNLTDVSQTYIDINSFTFTTGAPIDPAIAELNVGFSYSNANLNLPTPLPNPDGNGDFTFLNPWWSEHIIKCTREKEFSTVYTITTVDNAIDTVDQDYSRKQPDAIQPISFTSDLFFIVQNIEYDPNEYDYIKTQKPRHELNLERVPHAEIDLKYLSLDDRILSKTNLRLKGRGYTPSEFFGFSMPGSELKSIGAGILGLLATKDLDMVFSVITEIIFAWSETLNNTLVQDDVTYINPNGFGVLPDYLYKSSYFPPLDQISLARKVNQVAWLTLSILQAVKIFKNLPPQTRLQLPEKLDLFLKHHLYYIASYTDPSSGWIVEEINEYAIATDIRDIETLVVGHLALSESLSTLYDPYVHQRAAVSYLRAKEFTGIPRPENFEFINSSNLSAENFKALSAMLLFNYRYGFLNDVPRLIRSYIQLVTDEGVLPANMPLFLYLVDQFGFPVHDLDFNEQQYWVFNNFYSEVQPGLFRVLTETSSHPSLFISSWGNIYNQGFNIFVDEPFNLFAEEADAYVAYAYQNAKRMWPYGYRWTSSEFELAKQGVVGSLLFSIAKQTFAWYLQFAIFRQGRFLDQAQGWAADRWAETVGYRRPVLQSDKYLLNSVRSRYASAPSDLESLSQRLQTIYQNTFNDQIDNSILIREPSIPDIVEFTAPSTYISRPWTGSPDDVRSVINAGGHPTFNQPGFLTPPSPGQTQPTFTPWVDVAPKLEIDAFGYHPNLKQEIDNIAPYGVGININLIISARSYEYPDADINITIFNIGGSPNECYLGLNDDILSINFNLLTLEGACCLEGIELDDGSLWITDGGDAIKADGFDCVPDVPPPPPLSLVFQIQETLPNVPLNLVFQIQETLPNVPLNLVFQIQETVSS